MWVKSHCPTQAINNQKMSFPSDYRLLFLRTGSFRSARCELQYAEQLVSLVKLLSSNC